MVLNSDHSNKPLPEGWEWSNLGDIAKPERIRVSPQDYAELSFIGMDDVESETMRLLGTKKSQDMKSSSEHFFPGDVLYGSLRPYLNKVYRPEFEGLCSAEFIVFRNAPDLDNKYLQYFLNQWSFVSFINRQNTGDRPRVKFGQMADYPFPLAPISEQQRIVAEIEKQFTRLDQAVASLKRAQANLQRYKASVLKTACDGRLVPQDPNDETAEKLLQRILAERRSQWEEQEWAKLVQKAQKKVAQSRRKAQGLPARLSDLEPEEWQDVPEDEYGRYLPKNDKWTEKYKEPEAVDTAELPSLPNGWVWASIEQLNPGDRSCAYGVLQPGPNLANGIRLVRVGDIQEGQINVGDMKRISPEIAEKYRRTKLAGGEVLISLVGAIGRTAVVPTSLEGANTARAVGVMPLTNFVFSAWVEIWFRNPQKIQEMTSKAHEVARKTLNLEDVRTANVAIPPRSEQDRIVAEVERRLSVIAANEKAIATDLARAERLRQSILQQAFSGQLFRTSGERD